MNKPTCARRAANASDPAAAPASLADLPGLLLVRMLPDYRDLQPVRASSKQLCQTVDEERVELTVAGSSKGATWGKCTGLLRRATAPLRLSVEGLDCKHHLWESVWPLSNVQFIVSTS